MRDLVVVAGFFALAQIIPSDIDAQPRPAPPQAVRPPASAPTAGILARAATMPRVVGLTVDSARKLLASSRLPVTARDSSTKAAPRNQVIAQEPPEGTVLSTVREIVLGVAVPVRRVPPTVSIRAPVVRGVIAPPNSVLTTLPPPPPRPPATTVVPPLVGRAVQDVLRLLTRARLRPDLPPATDYSDIAAAGFVFQQHPIAGTKVDTESLVKIWISRGPRPVPATVTTPNVTGLTLDSAGRVIRSVRLVLGLVDTTYESGGSGRVEHQLPEPLSQSHPGDAVALRIAVSPPLVVVPRVIGLRRATARDSLRAVGLELGEVTPVRAQGRGAVIVAQRPSAGVEAPRGAFVDVDENQPGVPRRTMVPDLEGMTRDSAARLLASDSLVLGKVVVSDSGSSPVVVAQKPKAQEMVFSGASVAVTLATRGVDTPPPRDTVLLVSVPRVENMALEPARRLIDSVGLVAVSTSSDAGSSFVVDSQNPSGGSLVPFKATVKLFLKRVSPLPVPHLVGLRRATAESHAHGDGYTMDVQHQQRVVWQLFERVATQEPDTETIARGDRFINVDLSIPFIPVPLSATILVLAVGGTAAKVRPGRSKPLTDLDMKVELSNGPPPVLAPVFDDRLIRSAITFTIDSGRGDWIVASSEQSLVARIRDCHA